MGFFKIIISYVISISLFQFLKWFFIKCKEHTLVGMVISLVIWSGVGVIVAMAAELSIDVIVVFGVIVDTAKYGENI